MFYGSNHYSLIIPFQYAWFSNAFYLKPDYRAITKYNWNQIQVELKYCGADPRPNGNYCFGDEIAHGLRDDNHYHIDHVNWYNNGFLLESKDSIFSIKLLYKLSVFRFAFPKLSNISFSKFVILLSYKYKP